jgi:hypothetical protein
MSKHDGGHAFPQQYDDQDGMTLRDYFAAKAMQGMFAADTSKSAIPESDKARLAYEMADAMLKEREVAR